MGGGVHTHTHTALSDFLPELSSSSLPLPSDPQSQLSRLMRRNGLTQAEAEARIAAQLPLDQKVKLAGHVIDNSGDVETTRKQVLKLHSSLEDSMDFLLVRILAITAAAGVSGLLYFLLQQLMS